MFALVTSRNSPWRVGLEGLEVLPEQLEESGRFRLLYRTEEGGSCTTLLVKINQNDCNLPVVSGQC